MVVDVVYFVMVAAFLVWMAVGMPYTGRRMSLPMPQLVKPRRTGHEVSVVGARLSPEALAALIEGSGATVLCVEDRLDALIVGTTGVDPTEKDLRTLAAERRMPMVLYCRTGGKSAAVAAVLSDEGHQGVFWLDGGVEGWTKSGRSVRPAKRW